MIKTIKPVKISFLIIFLLILLVSCPNKPSIDNKNRTEEKRDENGHLEKIEYFNNGTLYKTEYYEYLNKHDEDSRLIKIVINDIIDDEMEQYDRTVEDGQTIYEMKDCWKVAYALQNNIYIGYVITQGHELTDGRLRGFESIQNNQATIVMYVDEEKTTTAIYFIKTYSFQMDYDPKLIGQILNYNFEKNEFNEIGMNYWTYRIR